MGAMSNRAHTCTNHTVPYGTALWVGAVPGTSCQATIASSLWDGLFSSCPRHFVPGYDHAVAVGQNTFFPLRLGPKGQESAAFSWIISPGAGRAKLRLSRGFP